MSRIALVGEQLAHRACHVVGAESETRGALPLDERDVRVLLRLQRDPDERRSRRERGLHASLSARDDRKLHARHDLVAREHAFDEHAPVLFEIAEVVDGGGDEDPHVELAQRADDVAHELRGARRDRDVHRRLREKALDAFRHRQREMRVDRSRVRAAHTVAVAARILRLPLVDVLARDAEHLRHVGDERQVAEQQRAEARHALDAELVRDAVETVRVDRQPRRARVVQPAAEAARQPALERKPEPHLRQRQQAALEHGRHE